MIRQATLEDAGKILEMCYKFFKASGYRETFNIEFNPTKVAEHIGVAIANPKFYCILVDSEYRGMIIGVLSPIMVNPDKLMASELSWWVEPEFRGTSVAKELMKAFLEWSIVQKAHAVDMATIEELDGERVGKLYTRLGFTKSESHYIIPVGGEN